MSVDNPTLEELRLLHALSNVCSQYMPGRWEYVNYEAFAAGRYGVEILAEYGLVKHDPGFGGEWTTKAIIVRERDEITVANYEQIKAAYLSDEGELLSTITRAESLRSVSKPLLPLNERAGRINSRSNDSAFSRAGTYRAIGWFIGALAVLLLGLARRADL